MKKRLQRPVYVVRKQSGQSLVEYAPILALIAVVAVLVLHGLGQHVIIRQLEPAVNFS
jgi:Flp pilus assembly pilin Flp